MTEMILSILLVLGGLLGLISSYGLLRLKQPMQRLHSATKAATVGLGAVLIASIIQNGGHLEHNDFASDMINWINAVGWRSFPEISPKPSATSMARAGT